MYCHSKMVDWVNTLQANALDVIESAKSDAG